MSAETANWPILSHIERRILGVLVEKAKTTPDAYPLTINAMVTGANQKTNRDPLMNVTDMEIEDALPQLQQKGLVTRITGSRVERWRHNLYDVWKVNKVELAILTELLLRGAQTEGELRGRASRMEPIDDLDALRLPQTAYRARVGRLSRTRRPAWDTTDARLSHPTRAGTLARQRSARGTSR